MRGPAGADSGLIVPSPAQLAALLAAALPGEELTAEELAATLYDDPDGDVLGTADGLGAVGVAVRGTVGFVTVVAVDPSAQRHGRGRALLDAAHDRLRARGATEVRTGASAPRYLWPGVDEDAHSAALSLFAAAGYSELATTRNHSCSTAYRAAPPDGVEVRRIRQGSDDEAALLAFTEAHWPRWVDEVSRAAVTGCCHGAFDVATGAAVGFGCHSVNRAGWIGPMGTDPARQGSGIGAALLGAVCRDLDLAEFADAEIAWVGPDAFYERAVGSRVSRRFRILGRPL